MIELIEKWEDLDVLPIPASTAIDAGDALSFNGSGSLIPSVPGVPIVGFSGMTVASTDPDYASAVKQIQYQKAGAVGQNKFSCPVGVGTAIVSMVGKTFNIYATDPGSIDLGAYQTLIYNTVAVSTFAVGHVITGTTSSATGTITKLNTLPDGSLQMIIGTITGTFVNGETITDGTSSATAKIGVIAPNGVQLKVENVLSTTLVEVSVASTA